MVAALEPSLPCLWPMLKLVKTKVIVEILGGPLLLMVSSLSQDSLKKRYRVGLIQICSLTTAVLTLETTIPMTLELVQTSLR